MPLHTMTSAYNLSTCLLALPVISSYRPMFIIDIMVDCFLRLMVLLQRHADLSVCQEDQSILFQFLHSAVDRLDRDAAFLIESLPGFRKDDLLLFFNLHGSVCLQYVIQKDKMRRIEEAGSPVVGRTIKFVRNFLCYEAQEMDISADPVLEVLP